MGLFDYVYCEHAAFVCSEGHDLRDHEFQTKGLGCTMGSAEIGSRISIRDGGWGDTQPSPFSGTIEVYTDCRECPVFVQNETFNLHPVSVEFTVEIAKDMVRSVTRTGKSSAEQIAEAPTLEYMPGCRGPFDYETANKRHIDRKFFPWDPRPEVDEATKERQRAWRARIDEMNARIRRRSP